VDVTDRAAQPDRARVAIIGDGRGRPLLSNDFYPAFNRPNLEVVTDSIDFIRDKAVVTQDGVERSVDTLLLATGYETTKYASVIDVVGRNGASLTAAWRDGAQAYLGITTAGFPNFFPERMASYNEEIQRTISGVAHWQAGCNGYYRSPSGRVVTQWPSTMTEYRDRVEVPDPDDFVTAVTKQALD
jgi:cyclohexanone monooxygenase